MDVGSSAEIDKITAFVNLPNKILNIIPDELTVIGSLTDLIIPAL